MRTRSAKLDELISGVSSLDELARRVQVDDLDAGAAAAKALVEAYDAWFAECLAVLPEDLREKFRFEYEGHVPGLKYRIKHFLHEPLRPRPRFFGGGGKPSSYKGILGYWQHPYKDRFRGPIDTQKQLLLEARARANTEVTPPVDALDLLERLARRLPHAYTVLASPGRRPVEIHDEYDVQRILHAVAVLHFDDVRAEEATPSMAGASSRLDFLLREERIAIETKFMRPSLSEKKVREELANDIVYFRAHPAVGSLFVYVYDPQRTIRNPRGFERDLASAGGDLPVRAVIAT
ncbi:PD-(D/E)XK nuclease domain-containing protein [Saccharothrix deserti]|uniref:PD-(D/E)XK nuclease domain-containing protein n=1 Tax=Saccharothrix deserti TaxID=2593674 RepID=UPI00131B8C35|nr:hypothetical protein [Saccharothrix deserti]